MVNFTISDISLAGEGCHPINWHFGLVASLGARNPGQDDHTHIRKYVYGAREEGGFPRVRWAGEGDSGF